MIIIFAVMEKLCKRHLFWNSPHMSQGAGSVQLFCPGNYFVCGPAAAGEIPRSEQEALYGLH